MSFLKQNKKMVLIIVGILALVAVATIVVIGMTNKNGGNSKSDDTGILEGYLQLLTEKDDEFFFADSNGKITKYKGYSEMGDFYKDVSVVKKDGEYALINKNEKTIVPFEKYDKINELEFNFEPTDFYRVQNDDKKYGVINNKGKEVLECKYKDISLGAGNTILAKVDDSKYDIYTSDSKLLMQVNEKSPKIALKDKLNDSYNDIIYITTNNTDYYYNTVTGEKLFEIESGNKNNYYVDNLSYNVLVKNVGTTKNTSYTLTFLDKKGKEIKTENAIEKISRPSVSNVGDKYIIVEQQLNSKGSKKGKYTIYDENSKEVFSNENPLNGLISPDGKFYFFQDNVDNVVIYNEKFETIKTIDGGSYSNSTVHDTLPFILIYQKSANRLDEYNFKGEKINESVKFSIFSTDYIVLEEYDNNKNKTKTRVYTLDCKSSIELTGEQKCSSALVNHNVLISDGDKYKVMNIDNKKVTFEFNKNDYSNNTYKNVGILKLKDGYYNFQGKKVLDI